LSDSSGSGISAMWNPSLPAMSSAFSFSSQLPHPMIAARPWVVDGELAVRSVMTISVSFDHRIVDVEQGSRFLSDVAAIVRDPGSTLLYV
jgi:hypothetical protein